MCAINKQEGFSQDTITPDTTNTSSTTLSILNDMVRDLERRTTELTRENSQLHKTLQSLEGDDDESSNDDETDTVLPSDHLSRQTLAAMKTDSVSCLWNDDAADDDEVPLLGTNRLQSKLINNALRSSQERKLRKSIWGRLWESDAALSYNNESCTDGDHLQSFKDRIDLPVISNKTNQFALSLISHVCLL
jgi:hypothetical protein